VCSSKDSTVWFVSLVLTNRDGDEGRGGRGGERAITSRSGFCVGWIVQYLNGYSIYICHVSILDICEYVVF
jgi:hypothetical protein